jgi:ABC-type polysaccharide/polyol phosphate export permease
MIDYLRAVWHYRYFWQSLVRMDLRARYRGSLLGIGWSLLHPIAMTVILCGAFGTLMKVPIREFAPYLMAGLTFWGFFTNVSLLGTYCFFQAEPYIRQHPTPLAIYPLRTMLGQAFHSLIAYGLVILLAAVAWRIPNPLALLSLVPTFLLLMLFGWSLAAFFGIVNVRFGDAKHVTDLGFQALYFLSPIMYPPSVLEDAGYGFLLKINPLVPFLHLVRDPLLKGTIPALSDYAGASALVLVVFVGTAAMLRYEERRLIFVL